MGYEIRLDFSYWRGTRQVSEPYWAYVPHPLAGWNPELTQGQWELLAEAADRLAGLMARPDWADPHPSTDWVIRRLEGIASSGVEGLRSTLRSVTAHQSLRQPSSPTDAEEDEATVGAWRQVRAALDQAEGRAETSLADILKLHRVLLGNTSQVAIAGRLKMDQNWISDPSIRTPAKAFYVPPPPDLTPELMQDLVEYVSSNEHDPLLAACVAHAQFEAIHPFDDGNGRTGRALMHLMLRRRGATSPLPIPFSAALEARRSFYFTALNAHHRYIGPPDHPDRSKALAGWLDMWTDAVEVACRAAEVVIERLGAVIARWEDIRFRSGSSDRRALEVMMTCPVMTAPALAERLDISEQAARRCLRRLVDAGAIAEAPTPRNGRRYEAPEILDLVDERRALMDDLWTAFRPDWPRGGDRRQADDAEANRSNGQQTAASTMRPPRCLHVGALAKTRCKLLDGHLGQHRYRLAVDHTRAVVIDSAEDKASQHRYLPSR